ncbi:MAG: hypothetical protein WBB45_00155 [Cyclobacteriaceae bacterium]
MFLPEKISVEGAFSTYERIVEADADGVLHYSRKLVVNEGRYPPEQYEALREFIQKLYDADNEKIILTGES